jgi:hypothetical protein
VQVGDTIHVARYWKAQCKRRAVVLHPLR